jgi:hypothetical protein
MRKSSICSDGAVGLISIHLAFYQMNPWPTALAAFSIFGNSRVRLRSESFAFGNPCRFVSHRHRHLTNTVPVGLEQRLTRHYFQVL